MVKPDRKKELELILTKAEAQEVVHQGDEAIVFKLLELSKEIQELRSKLGVQDSSSTPSGQIPVYQKPSTSKSRKKPGRKKGHVGVRRKAPIRIDHHQTHTLDTCPHCGDSVGKPTRRRKRVIEDIIDVEPEATEHEIEGYYCKTCKKIVEPVVVDALHKASIGHRTVALAAWLHYGVGITISQIINVYNFHLSFSISQGGLVQMWYRTQEILYGWYEQIGKEAKSSAVLHGDESGWRVSGSTHWLWCFTNPLVTYYMIQKSRGSPALFKFFGEAFEGCLISDFWKPYDMIHTGGRQYCMAHLLREIHDVDEKNQSPDWVAFSKKLRRLLGDALRLRTRRDQISQKEFDSKNARFDGRLEDLIFQHGSGDPDVKRIADRLTRSMEGLFTFLEQPDVEPTNNMAEREIRPAVIIRKNSLGNRSEKGANCQAVLMSIYRTLKKRGLNPIDTVVEALRKYVETGTVPPLPASHG